MCGVMGYVGGRAPEELLLRGLERLEHRGYDSAGLCLVSPDGLRSVRSVGPLADLRSRVNGDSPGSTAGIAHTRWATHGPVAERNAHPLPAGTHDDVAIVLNGIVENHASLRPWLVDRGETFTSDTDAEVVAHLIRRAYDGDLLAAVCEALPRVAGSVALLAVHRDHPEALVAARRDCPLLIGVGRDEHYVASSAAAFAPETRNVKLLDDGDVAEILRDDVRVVAEDGVLRRRRAIRIADPQIRTGHAGYPTHMRQEIDEQPLAIARTVSTVLESDLVRGAVEAFVGGGISRLLLVGCGSALHAGEVSAHALRSWAGVPCATAIASEWRYAGEAVAPDTLVVAISQSGETADTLACVRLARAHGARTIALTNSPESQITREVEAILPTVAGPEIGVAATKTFTAQVAALQAFAILLGAANRSLGEDERHRLLRRLHIVRFQLRRCLGTVEAAVDEVAERHRDAPFFMFIGRQAAVPVCREGALKLKEIAYAAADALPAGEMKHGPIAQITDGTPVICVATESHVMDKLAGNIEEVRARGADVVSIVSEGDPAAAGISGRQIAVPRTDPLLAPLLAVAPLQLLAHRIAELRGLDVDRPRNLAKTVTVE